MPRRSAAPAPAVGLETLRLYGPLQEAVPMVDSNGRIYRMTTVKKAPRWSK